MKEEISKYQELMIRQLDGYASAEEITELQEWLNASVDNRAEFKAFEKIWNKSRMLSELKNINTEKALEELRTKLNQKSTLTANNKGRRITLRFIHRAAAAVLFLIAATAVVYFFSASPSDKNILLADGTKVWLNKNANLDYPNKFNADIRTVTLYGEAYFEVAENPDKPFVIKTEKAQIEVLGTSFNVEAGKDSTNIIVNTGKVKFSVLQNAANSVVLTAGKKAKLMQQDIVVSINNDKNYRSWQSGIFYFEQTPIKEVLPLLSEYYGPLLIAPEADVDCELTADFQVESKNTIIQTLKNSCSFQIKKKGEQVIFY